MTTGSKKNLQRQLIPGMAPTSGFTPKGEVEPQPGRWLHRVTERAVGLRRKAATVVLIALSVSLGAYAIFGHDGLVAYQQKQHQAQQLQQQILSLKQENQRLALRDQRLQSDRDTIEYEAREQMHYTRPGEVIYTLPEAPHAATQRK